MHASGAEFTQAVDTLDNLAFDATHNYAAWMSKVDQARLQATKRLVPETEHRQDFQQYCDGFLSLPRNYETMCIYLDSNTHWSAGDVVHFPTSSDGQYHSITKLCNIGDLYRWEDSPSDTPDITGAYSLSGLMEMEVSGLDGSRWTRHVLLCPIDSYIRPTSLFILQGTHLKMQRKSHMNAI